MKAKSVSQMTSSQRASRAGPITSAATTVAIAMMTLSRSSRFFIVICPPSVRGQAEFGLVNRALCPALNLFRQKTHFILSKLNRYVNKKYQLTVPQSV